MNMNEISEEINRLEGAETNYTNCDKLATLYTVRNGLKGPQSMGASAPGTMKHSYSYSVSPETDFVKAFNALPKEYALSVLNEHIEAIRALYPKEYRALMRKLNIDNLI